MSSKFKNVLIFLGVGNFIYSILLLLNILIPMEKIYVLASLMISFSVIGILKYKKWGVYLYLIGLGIIFVIHLVLKVSLINYLILLLQLILIYPVRYSWSEFSRENSIF